MILIFVHQPVSQGQDGNDKYHGDERSGKDNRPHRTPQRAFADDHRYHSH